MKTEIIIKIADWIFSITLMVSFYIASRRNEKFESLQFNVVNIIVGCAFVVIAMFSGLYGYALRQAFFVCISTRNLYNRFINKI